MRSVSAFSSTSISTTRSSFLPVSASIWSSALAWASVRGKPSRMKPLAQSACAIRSRIRPTISASGTSSPFSMMPLAFLPSWLPEATAARSMSPVESWTRPRSRCRSCAWVPLPAPGGPRRMRFIDHPSSAPAPQSGFLDQALVLVGKQVGLDLGHRVERDRDHDQEAGAAEVERHAAARDQQFRQDADRREVEGTDHGQPVQYVFQVVGCVLAGADAGYEAAVLLEVVGGVGRLEHHGGVAEAEEDDQADIGQEVERLAVAEPGSDPLHPAGLAGTT